MVRLQATAKDGMDASRKRPLESEESEELEEIQDTLPKASLCPSRLRGKRVSLAPWIEPASKPKSLQVAMAGHAQRDILTVGLHHDSLGVLRIIIQFAAASRVGAES